MRRSWKAAVGAVVFAVAAVLFSPAVAQAQPPAAAGKDFSKPAIVILGYGLNSDGSPRWILHTRVLAGLAVAQFFPQSPIIVTGGNPKNGNTEAGEMRKMLALMGFPGDRIIMEEKANSTVQNAQFSVPLAKKAGTSVRSIEVCGDRHHVTHRRVILRSRKTVLFEQAYTRLLDNAPTLGDKIIPYRVTLAAVDESCRVDVESIDLPSNIGGGSPAHFAGNVGVVLGGKLRSRGAQRPNGVE